MYPDDLGYTREHEWVRDEGDHVLVGITAYAQEELGDVVYVDLPPAGTEVSAGEPCAEIESTKTVAELYAPVDGEVTAANDDLDGQPELVNTSPYDQGWMIRLRIADGADLEGMLDSAAYRTLIETG